MKKKIYISAILLACLAFFTWYWQKNDFCLSSLEPTLPADRACPINNKPVATETLTQAYYYSGKGYLSYAFTSKDGQFLLRFLRRQRLGDPSIWLQKEKAKKRQERRELLFTSYKIACDILSEETGLLFLQLQKSQTILPQTTLFDTQKRAYSVDLNQVAFLLQRKAQDAKTTIEALMNEKRVDEAKKRLVQIFALLQSTTQKGVLHTSGLTSSRLNVGFTKNRAIYIDCAKLQMDSESTGKALFIKNLRPLKTLNRWLMLHYPELSIYYQSLCKETLSTFDKESS